MFASFTYLVVLYFKRNPKSMLLAGATCSNIVKFCNILVKNITMRQTLLRWITATKFFHPFLKLNGGYPKIKLQKFKIYIKVGY